MDGIFVAALRVGQSMQGTLGGRALMHFDLFPRIEGELFAIDACGFVK